MHEDVDDDEEDVILDRRTLIHQSNETNSSSNSGPILLGVNRFNIKVYDDPIKLSQTKVILLSATCISIVCNYNILINLYFCCFTGYVYWIIRTNISIPLTTYAG